jgi:cytochrome c553
MQDMPQIAGKKIFLAMYIALAVSALLISAGCSDSNTQVTFDPLDGHPGNWVDAHGSAALSEADQCIECHGRELLCFKL